MANANVMSKSLRESVTASPAYKVCMLYGHHGHVCGGRLTKEHAIIHKGKKVQRGWAIISLCARGHEVDKFQDAHTGSKELNEWVALCRATDDDILALSGEVFVDPNLSKVRTVFQKKKFLIKKYGEWKQIYNPSILENTLLNFALDEAARQAFDHNVTGGEKVPSTIVVPGEFAKANYKVDVRMESEERVPTEKPFFYSVQEAQKHMVQDCIDYFKEGEDRHFSPSYIITEAIRRYHEDIMRLKDVTR